MSSFCSARKVLTLSAPILTIVIGSLQLWALFSWSKEEFEHKSCRHSKQYYQDSGLPNATDAQIACERHHDKAYIMNIVAIVANLISIILSVATLFGVSDSALSYPRRKLLILPYCIYHFAMIPISIFSDMFFKYIPLVVMFIGIGFYLGFIAILLAYLRNVSPHLKRKRANKRAGKSSGTKTAKKLSVEEGKDVDDDEFACEFKEDFKYKKIPAFFASN